MNSGFKLPPLNYDYSALNKYISQDIMRLHHQKHHQTYVDKLNEALKAYPDLKNQPIEALLKNLVKLPPEIQSAVQDFGGGHYNHSLFWQFMTPHSTQSPSGELGKAIDQKYGDFQTFVDQFETAATTLFGSGWVWLQPDLSIQTSANQDSLLSKGQPAPILGLDVWEHAYYLDYQNRRADYIKAWWNVVDWQFVDDRWKSAAAD